MKSFKPFALSLSLSLVCVMPAHSYNPATGHRPLAEYSFTAYKECFGADPIVTAEFQRRVIAGDVASDEGYRSLPQDIQDEKIKGSKKLLNIARRPFNWHFTNKENSSQSAQQGLILKSFHGMWKEAFDRFKGTDVVEEKALFLGTLMHLLEDTSVPAHVAPVYHGPTSINALGNFEKYTDYMQDAHTLHDGMLHDSIDSIRPDATYIEEHKGAYLQQRCAAVKSQNLSLDKIVQLSIDKTHEHMDQAIPECGNIKWRRFWNADVVTDDKHSSDDDSEEYFKAYPKHVLFGHHGVLYNNEEDRAENMNRVCAMREGDGRYAEFVLKRHLQAIEMNVRLIRWAVNFINNPPQ